MHTVTSTSLLRGLREAGNEQVWTAFVQRYQPLLVSFVKRLGVRDTDAEDVAQESLIAFLTGYRKGLYDPEKGRLRTWLLAITTNKARDFRRRAPRDRARGGVSETTALLDAIPDDASMSEIWEAEWRAAVLKACIDELRHQVEPVTLEAFELYALKEWPAMKVAEHLGITRNAVFLAKSRLLARLKEMQLRMEEIW
jgi:RNA polymerase sigma-70 factor (ECF subfamily)